MSLWPLLGIFWPVARQTELSTLAIPSIDHLGWLLVLVLSVEVQWVFAFPFQRIGVPETRLYYCASYDLRQTE